jgi:hypothetical protein
MISEAHLATSSIRASDSIGHRPRQRQSTLKPFISLGGEPSFSELRVNRAWEAHRQTSLWHRHKLEHSNDRQTVLESGAI